MDQFIHYVSTYDHGLIKVEYTDLYSPETWSLTQFSTHPNLAIKHGVKDIEDRNIQFGWLPKWSR